MKLLPLLFTLLCAGQLLHSQSLAFQRGYGSAADDESASCIVQTPDGGYIIGGRKEMSPLLTHDLMIVKTDAVGDTVWTRCYGGPGEENCWSIVPINAGYFVFGGTTSYGSGNWDIMCMILGLNGDTIRTRVYGGPQDDYGLQGAQATQTLEGDLIFSGMTMSYGAGGFDAYLLKTNISGNLIWSKTYGGIYSEQGASIVQTPDSGFAFAGYTSSFGAGSTDFLLIRTDRDGNLLWSKTYGGADMDICSNVSIAADGGFYLSGFSKSFATGPDEDMLVIKTDSAGNFLWATNCSGSQPDWATNGRATSDGGYVVTGKSMSFNNSTEDFILAKFNSSGNIVWAKDYPGMANEIAFGLSATSDGGYVICGGSSSFAASTAKDILLMKTDSNGTVGCNEFSIPYSLTNPAVIVTTPALQVASGGVALPSSPVKTSGTGSVTICTNVGITEPPAEEVFRIYPVPFTTSATIEIAATDIGGKSCTFIMYDMLGNVVLTQPVTSTTTALACVSFPPGVYTCKLITDSGDTRITRIVVNQ